MDDFDGNLPNSEIEQVMVRHLESSKMQFDNCVHRDKDTLANLEEDVDYWSRMQELMSRIRQAEVVLRHDSEDS